MLTNNIIVVDSYFNLTIKSNLTDLLQFLHYNSIVAYLFGPPCILFVKMTPDNFYVWNKFYVR